MAQSRLVFGSVRAVAAFVLVFVFLVGSFAPAFAIGGTNGTLTGTVVDATTKAPLRGVTVTVASAALSEKTTTDDRGVYRFVGLPVDTYQIAFSIANYEATTLNGVTLQGDGIVSQDVNLTKTIQTIGRVASRSQSQAFQPKQTTDTYQVSGAQLQTALGKSFNISQTQLQSSVPGIQQTVYGSSSIRGSTRTELAYQFDGINYTDPALSQFQNSLGINGLQSLQVNPGAGDATQGNAGAGAINIVVKRGSRPAFGQIDLEAVGYPFTHQLGLEYGWATPTGKFSNYTSFLAQNQDRIYGPIGSPALYSGSLFATEFVKTRDIVNNTVYRFGHDNSRSLQLLLQDRLSDFNLGRNGWQNYFYKSNDPTALPNLTIALPGVPTAARTGEVQSLLDLLPGQPNILSNLVYQPHQYQPVDVAKLEYDQLIDSNTYWANRLYHVVGTARFDSPYTGTGPASRILYQGGGRVGFSGDFIRTAGKHQVDVSYLYESQDTQYDYTSNLFGFRAASGLLGTPGFEVADFIQPGQPCPTSDLNGNALSKTGNVSGNGCGYLYNPANLAALGSPNGQIIVPSLRAYGGGHSQIWGIGLRDQFTVSSKLRLDYGIRLDADNQQIVNAYSYINDDSKHPRVIEPRFAGSYQISSSDAIRASYGRSTQFVPGVIINNPVATYTQFNNIASRDPRTGLVAKTCVAPLFTSACVNYAQQLHDEYVQSFGLENANVKPATYNNYDVSYAHQFKGNIGLKVTPFFKRGYDVNVFSTPVVGTDVNTGLPIFGAARLSNLGIDKSTGVEFYLTKDVPYGVSGFVDFTYVNRLQNVPPGYGGQLEDFYPSIPPVSVQLGQLYKAGYLSPLTGRVGLTYKNRGGLRVNPIFSYDRGFPIGAGTLVAASVNGTARVVGNTNASTVGGGPVANAGTSLLVTQYVSPTNPGSILNPNIAATRGTSETSLAGGVLSRARGNLDLSFELSAPGSKNTFGAYISNVFNLVYSEPGLNSRWQPVATGIGGPQTGQSASTQSLGATYGFYNYGRERFGRNAYNLVQSGAPTAVRFYYQLAL